MGPKGKVMSILADGRFIWAVTLAALGSLLADLVCLRPSIELLVMHTGLPVVTLISLGLVRAGRGGSRQKLSAFPGSKLAVALGVLLFLNCVAAFTVIAGVPSLREVDGVPVPVADNHGIVTEISNLQFRWAYSAFPLLLISLMFLHLRANRWWQRAQSRKGTNRAAAG